MDPTPKTSIDRPTSLDPLFLVLTVIEGIYQYRTKLGLASFPDYLDEDVEITALGQAHKLGGTYKGRKAFQDMAYEFANTLDLSKPHNLDILGHWRWRAGLGLCGVEGHGHDHSR